MVRHSTGQPHTLHQEQQVEVQLQHSILQKAQRQHLTLQEVQQQHLILAGPQLSILVSIRV